MIALLAVWLPATLHCGLESSDLLPPELAATCDESTDGHCSIDLCTVIEADFSHSGSVLLKAPSPAAPICLYLIELADPDLDLSSRPKLAAGGSEGTVPWMPVRHFVQRAAPLSRAPSALV